MPENKPDDTRLSATSAAPGTAPDGAVHADAATLETLHERVNAMLEIPLPKEGDAFPLPVEEAIAVHPPA